MDFVLGFVLDNCVHCSERLENFGGNLVSRFASFFRREDSLPSVRYRLFEYRDRFGFRSSAVLRELFQKSGKAGFFHRFARFLPESQVLVHFRSKGGETFGIQIERNRDRFAFGSRLGFFPIKNDSILDDYRSNPAVLSQFRKREKLRFVNAFVFYDHRADMNDTRPMIRNDSG